MIYTLYSVTYTIAYIHILYPVYFKNVNEEAHYASGRMIFAMDYICAWCPSSSIRVY